MDKATLKKINIIVRDSSEFDLRILSKVITNYADDIANPLPPRLLCKPFDRGLNYDVPGRNEIDWKYLNYVNPRIPNISAIYYLFNEKFEMLYIGQTGNLNIRMDAHKIRQKTVKYMAYIKCEPENLLATEKAEIQLWNPPYNKTHRTTKYIEPERIPDEPDEPRDYKKEIRIRDKYTCQNCELVESDGKEHMVHYIDYDKNDDPVNLITLCKNCYDGVNDDLCFDDKVQCATHFSNILFHKGHRHYYDDETKIEKLEKIYGL